MFIGSNSKDHRRNPQPGVTSKPCANTPNCPIMAARSGLIIRLSRRSNPLRLKILPASDSSPRITFGFFANRMIPVDQGGGGLVVFPPRNGKRTPPCRLRLRNISRRNSQLPRKLAPLTLEFDRKNVEQVEQLPSQQEHGKQHNHDCHQLAKTEATAIRFEALRRKAENVQRGKTEYHCPENVIDVAARAAILQRHEDAKKRDLASNERIESHRGTTRPRDTRDERNGNREHDGRVKVAGKAVLRPKPRLGY
jgi:hypothetical protein